MADEPSSLPSPRSEGYSPAQHIAENGIPMGNGDGRDDSPDGPGSKDRQDRRSVEPPKNAEGKMICTHERPLSKCSELTFDRKCEWRKHMDKHERPFRCPEPSCAEFRGFTYQGGLLRHEREVHKKFGGPKELLNCPVPFCKRNTGVGFTRRENLNEHVRRVHRLDPTDAQNSTHNSPSPSEAVAAVAPQFVPGPEAAPTPQKGRKRKRTDVPITEPLYDNSEEIDAHEAVKRLQLSNAQKDDEIARLRMELGGRDERISRLEIIVQNLTSPQQNQARHVSPQ